MRKQCRLIIERKSLQRTEKKANGKSRRALPRFKFFPPRWSSPNPPFFLDISPEMFKKQNLLGHFKGAVSRNSAKLGNYKMPVKLRKT